MICFLESKFPWSFFLGKSLEHLSNKNKLDKPWGTFPGIQGVFWSPSWRPLKTRPVKGLRDRECQQTTGTNLASGEVWHHFSLDGFLKFLRNPFRGGLAKVGRIKLTQT